MLKSKVYQGVISVILITTPDHAVIQTSEAVEVFGLQIRRQMPASIASALRRRLGIVLSNNALALPLSQSWENPSPVSRPSRSLSSHAFAVINIHHHQFT